ncbi:MAG: 4Fe-4S binding protein [Clostridia bacterium]|nr:4Fe-4S binding protein [Clostridia bacterium]
MEKLNKRNIIRGLFLLLFVILWLTGKAQIWGQALLFGLLVVPLWGRLYCGYLCPISTTVDILGNIKSPRPLKENLKKVFFNNKFRTLIFLASVALLIITIKESFPVPFFVLLVPIGVIFTYLFSEAAWHRNCFIGTIYSWLGALSRKGYIIQDTFCSGCGRCAKVCPAACLEINSACKNIDNKHCLICGKCQEACPEKNIFYSRLKKGGGKTKPTGTASFNQE